MPAKNKIKNSKDEGVVHVKLDMPVIVRKSVLSAALNVANLLSTYDEIKTLKKKKGSLLDSINIQLLALKRDVNDLENKHLPELKFAQSNPQEKEIHTKEDLHETKVENKVYDSDIERLKAELLEIEKKLKHL